MALPYTYTRKAMQSYLELILVTLLLMKLKDLNFERIYVMGRESHDTTVVHSHSSIALLQERFRQLQRVKEMREERELLKLLSQPKQLNHNPTTSYEPTRLFLHPELVMPSRSPPHVSLTLWPTPLEEHPRSPDIPASTTLPSKDYTHSLQASWKNVYDCDHSDSDSGVDTSLHL